MRCAASRTTAKASGSKSSSDSPLAYRDLNSEVLARNCSSESEVTPDSQALTWSTILASWRRIFPSPARMMRSRMEAITSTFRAVRNQGADFSGSYRKGSAKQAVTAPATAIPEARRARTDSRIVAPVVTRSSIMIALPDK